ncbi:AraC family transcriptional regulator [Paenibacillus sp. HB172176]|uniref:helix-turn-helix transcriptional regulator n=1 Tax=Paenibacillus sp. HB172176 TaxID=2493690 RepID=UPI001438DD95|nr:AraC family transcriptional regulator [Paenibacillus sp. HB172176]
MITAMPLVDSIYLYRNSDGMVLTPLSASLLDHFTDKQVIVEALQQSTLNRPWTNMRSGFSQQDSEEMISLIRYTPLFTGTDGLIVVNVRKEYIIQLIQSLTKSVPNNHIAVYNRDGTPIYAEQGDADYIQATYVSDYLGWQIQNGVENGNLFRIVSTLSKYWILVCALFCLLGIAWIILAARQNYKPIQSILNRIQQFVEQKQAKLFQKENGDEFKFIDSALEQLLDQADVYQRQHKETLSYRRQRFFTEWLEGVRSFKQDAWKQDMIDLEMPYVFEEFVTYVIRINKYRIFAETYSRRDQNLLKFVLSNVVREIMETAGAVSWSEWMTNDRLTVITMIQDKESDYESESGALDKANSLVQWIDKHLDFSVSIGIGSSSNQPDLLSSAYEEAKEALAYQPSLGDIPVVGFWQLRDRGKHQASNPFHAIRNLAIAIRSGEEGWEKELDRMFDDIRNGVYSREEMTNFVSYLIFIMQKEMAGLSPDLYEIWKRSGSAELERVSSEWETLEELQNRLSDVLRAIKEEMANVRSERSNYKLVLEMRAYLEEHYNNPDMSLQLLGELFGLHVKTASRLFREEIGANFSEELTQIRIERAKAILINTEESIQDITTQVGYMHPNTFIRSFKKQTGQTPGEYRKASRG